MPSDKPSLIRADNWVLWTIVGGGLLLGFLVLLGTCDVVEEPSAPTPTPTYTPAPTQVAVSASVREGCVSAVLLDAMVTSFDMDGLDASGPDLMTAMVSTDDAILNFNGVLIAEAMVSFSEDLTAESLETVMDGFNAYIETCTNLGAITGQ